MLARLEGLGGIVDVGRGTRWTSAMLRREIGARSTALSNAGLGRGDVVVIAHEGSAPFLADLLAIWHVGAAVACLDPALSVHEQAVLLDFVQPAAFLTDGQAHAEPVASSG